MAIDGLDQPQVDGLRRVLIFAPEKEHHEIPLLFMHYLLRKNKVPVVYVGKNASLKVIKEFCIQQKVSELYFHLVTNLSFNDINAYLAKVSSEFPDKRIFFSGYSVVKVENPSNNIELLKDASAMLAYANR